MSHACRHGADFHVRNPSKVLTDPFQASLQFLFVADRFPLKRRVGFWYEAIQRRNNLSHTTETTARLEHTILDTLDKHDHFLKVVASFRRQANHQVKLHGQHPAIEHRATDIDDLVVRKILVDDLAQAIRSCLRCDCDLLIA